MVLLDVILVHRIQAWISGAHPGQRSVRIGRSLGGVFVEATYDYGRRLKRGTGEDVASAWADAFGRLPEEHRPKSGRTRE